jgi:hypothetical protein
MFSIITTLNTRTLLEPNEKKRKERRREGRWLTIGINMNAGQRINLRLRPPGFPDGFYEFDQLVLVMLHEVGPFIVH